MASAARALQRLARQLAAADASRRSAQLPACSGLMLRALPSLLGDRRSACPFSAQASELASNGEVRSSVLPIRLHLCMQATAALNPSPRDLS